MTYTGFLLRGGAAIIDAVLINVAAFVIGLVFGLFLRSAEQAESLDLLFRLLGLVIAWLYWALMESSPLQATVGKLAVGARVTDLEGKRISFGRATGRFFGRILSAVILLIGYFMALFTPKKQALHDMLAGTLVVNKA